MTTKYNNGDTVFVEAKVNSIHVYQVFGEDNIDYKLNIPNIPIFSMEESKLNTVNDIVIKLGEDIIDKLDSNEFTELTNSQRHAIRMYMEEYKNDTSI